MAVFRVEKNSGYTVMSNHHLRNRDGRMISIDCTGVEDELDVTMAQRTELDYLIYNDPLG